MLFGDAHSIRRIKQREDPNVEDMQEITISGDQVRNDGIGLPLRFWDEWQTDVFRRV